MTDHKITAEPSERPFPKLVCPECKAEMKATKFISYYDVFYCWTCQCDDETIEEKVEVERKGDYAC